MVKFVFDLLISLFKMFKVFIVFDVCLVSVIKSGIDDILMVFSINVVVIGNYEINVIQLVIVNKWIVDMLVFKIKIFGVGILMLDVGVGDKKKMLEIQVDVDDIFSLICIKIEKVGCSLGVQFILIVFGDNQFLFILQEKVGIVNVIKFSVGVGNVDLIVLVVSLFECILVVDVKFIIDGVEVVFSENIVIDVVFGLIFNLKKIGVSIVMVSIDVVVVCKVMQDFVMVYNGVISVINMVIKYDIENKELLLLIGDVQMCGVFSQLCVMMGGVFKDLVVVGLDLKILGLQICVYFNVDGSLVLDGVKFEVVLVNQVGVVCQVLMGDDGVVVKLFSMVEGYISIVVGKEGVFVLCIKSINVMFIDIDKCCKVLDVCMIGVEEWYKKQFLVLDVLMGKMSQIMSSLSSQLFQFIG